MDKKILIKNLDCAHCANELEEELNAIEGVDASVSFASQTVFLSAKNDAAYNEALFAIRNFEEVEIVSASVFLQKKIKIKNLDCAHCANELEEELLATEGVANASVSFATQTVTLTVADDDSFKEALHVIANFEEVEIVGEECESKASLFSNSTRLWLVIIAAILYVPTLIIGAIQPNQTGEAVCTALYALAYLTVGLPILLKTAKNLAQGKIFDENFLMTVASVGAIALGEFSEGVAVMLLYQLGEYLQTKAVGSSRKSIETLVAMKAEKANLLLDGVLQTVEPSALQIGDTIVVKKGEKVPVDCISLTAGAVFDTKSLTGEGAPKDVSLSDEVLAGYINVGNVVTLQVIREYRDSAVARILEMVENSSARKAAPEKFISKFARYYTPFVCLLAVAVGGIVPLLIGISTNVYPFAEWINRALTFLVISCPCAVVISVPLTYYKGIGKCAQNGILVKGANSLDDLSSVGVAVFDKTGTLTEGNFTVLERHCSDGIFDYASCLEQSSSHPIAKAFPQKSDLKAENVSEFSGMGLCGTIEDKIFLAGNDKLMRLNSIEPPYVETVNTVIHFAYGGEYVGYVIIGDVLKPEAKKALLDLKKLGVKKLVVLTGDSLEKALALKKELPMLDAVHAKLLPDEKAIRLRKLKSDSYKVVYAGDGINDAPVMTEADCAVSMGKLGSDSAIEASDVVLTGDHLSALPTAIRLSKRTRSIVVQNIVFSILCKLCFMILGVFGILPLWLAVFGDVGVMLLALLNSLRV